MLVILKLVFATLFISFPSQAAEKMTTITHLTSIEAGVLIKIADPRPPCDQTRWGWMFIPEHQRTIIDLATKAFFEQRTVRAFPLPRWKDPVLFDVPGTGGKGCHIWQLQVYRDQ